MSTETTKDIEQIVDDNSDVDESVLEQALIAGVDFKVRQAEDNEKISTIEEVNAALIRKPIIVQFANIKIRLEQLSPAELADCLPSGVAKSAVAAAQKTGKLTSEQLKDIAAEEIDRSDSMSGVVIAVSRGIKGPKFKPEQIEQWNYKVVEFFFSLVSQGALGVSPADYFSPNIK